MFDMSEARFSTTFQISKKYEQYKIIILTLTMLILEFTKFVSQLIQEQNSKMIAQTKHYIYSKPIMCERKMNQTY